MNQNDSVITSYFYLVYPHVSYGDISMVYLKRNVEDVINKSLPLYWGQFEAHTFHLVLSMWPIVLVATL